jgi:ATP-dependent Lon protease
VTTVEEEEYPQFYHLKPALDPKEQEQSETSVGTGEAKSISDEGTSMSGPASEAARPVKAEAKPVLEEGHHVFTEDRKGISYDRLFGPYIEGASKIIVTDPYVRYFYQIRNMMEFVEMVIWRKSPED